MRYRLTGMCALLLGLLATTPVMGGAPQTPRQSKEAAIALAEQGWAHYEAGRYTDALQAFRDAETTVHAPAFLLMVARSYDKLGRLLEARSVYRLLVDEKLPAGASAASVQAQADGKKELNALAQRLPTVEILRTGTVSGAVELTLDGVKVEPSTLVERDPGEHTLVARSAGRLPLTKTFRLVEGAKERIEIDQATLDAQPPATGSTGAAAQVRPPRNDGSGKESTARDARSAAWWIDPGSRTVILIGGGVMTGIGLATGISFLVFSGQKSDDAETLKQGIKDEIAAQTGQKRDCASQQSAPQRCAELNDALDASVHFKNAAFWGLLSAGAVGLGTAIYGITTRNSAEREKNLQVTPIVGAGIVGFSVGGAL